MDVLKPQVIPEWRIPRNPLWFAVRMMLHFCLIVVVFELTFPGRRAWLWLLTVAYYWFFYARMIRFAAWTSDTLGLIQRAREFSPLAQLRKLVTLADWPDFIVLIPAFGAGRCVQTVAAILAEQDYPAARWKAIFVSDEPEQTAADERASEVAVRIQNAVRERSRPESLPVAEAALILSVADNAAAPSADYLMLFDLSSRQTAEAWADLLTRLTARGAAPPSDTPEVARGTLQILAEQIGRSNTAAAANIATMMGMRAGESLTVGEQIWSAPRTPRGLAGELQRALRVPGPSLAALRIRVLSAGFQERIVAAFESANPSTGAAVDGILRRLNRPNMVHCRRPPGKRNKASALNFGFDQASERGWLGPHTHIMVLDSDSFLPVNALALSALEIVRDREPNVIRQLLPVTSTNFNGRNWCVRTIIGADSIAAPGRWAANVRTQVRCDLTAGSGVLIPATFLNHLIEAYGEAWDTSIICEDARMIITQYAVLDGVTKRTKMVPAYVLEGAPEQENVWPTYIAFWRQRLRWALGGMDEFASLLRVPLRRMLVSSSDFSVLPGGPRVAAAAWWRKFRLLFSWFKEHLWWSGIALAPLLWWTAELLCGAPPWPARALGYLCLFVIPGLLLQRLFRRRLAPLIPGGVSRRQLVELLFGLVCLSVPFILPVVFAQLVCLAGQRGRLAAWNPATPKPGSQFAMGKKTKSEQTLLVTDSKEST